MLPKFSGSQLLLSPTPVIVLCLPPHNSHTFYVAGGNTRNRSPWQRRLPSAISSVQIPSFQKRRVSDIQRDLGASADSAQSMIITRTLVGCQMGQSVAPKSPRRRRKSDVAMTKSDLCANANGGSLRRLSSPRTRHQSKVRDPVQYSSEILTKCQLADVS